MEEIEVKYLECSHEEYAPKIIELGGKKVFEGDLFSESFDTKDKKLSSEHKSIRIRKLGEQVIITMKVKEKKNKLLNLINSKAKRRIEHEIQVSDYDKAKQIINQLGFTELKFTNTKKRISYQLGNVKFEFDNYFGENEFVPEFLEIEAKSEQEIFKAAAKIGLKKEDAKTWTGKHVIKFYKEKLKLK
jgi:predicted adenylyl cyclase CyaB